MSESVVAGTTSSSRPPQFAHRACRRWPRARPSGSRRSTRGVARVGTWILIGADVFFFAALFFAFFYLRALNNNYSWLPAGTTHPTRGIGAIIVLLAIVAAALYWAGARASSTQRATARMFFWLALAGGRPLLRGPDLRVPEPRLRSPAGRRLSERVRRPEGRSGWSSSTGAHVLAGHARSRRPPRRGRDASGPSPPRRFGNFLVFLAGDRAWSPT